MGQNIPIQIVALLLKRDAHPRKLAKDLGVSHTTVLRKLRGLLDGNVVDFRVEGKNTVYLAGVKGAEREDPTLQDGDESGAALRHVLGAITRNYVSL